MKPPFLFVPLAVFFVQFKPLHCNLQSCLYIAGYILGDKAALMDYWYKITKSTKILFFCKQKQMAESSNFKLVLPMPIIYIQQWNVVKDIWIVLLLLGVLQFKFVSLGAMRSLVLVCCLL